MNPEVRTFVMTLAGFFMGVFIHARLKKWHYMGAVLLSFVGILATIFFLNWVLP